jgi:hypothetical protein
MFHDPILRRAALLAPALLFGLATAAGANTTLPPRKPGFWVTTMVMHMSMPGAPAMAQAMSSGAPIVSAMCTDPSIDALEMKRMTGDNGHCQSFDIEGGGSVYTVTGVCTDPMGGGTMTTHGTFTIASADEILVHSTTASAHMSGDMTGDSKWSGPCPAGIVPGDIGHMVNGNFVKLTNIKDMPQTPQ